MGEDGNYFSDFHRKLAEINFNWGISSMHKYRGNLHTSPHLPLLMVLKLNLTFGPSVSMLSSLCPRQVLGLAASVFLAYWQQLIFILID